MRALIALRIQECRTQDDVAKQLRVSSATVYRLIDSGELRHGRVSNAIRISQADLAAFLRGDS